MGSKAFTCRAAGCELLGASVSSNPSPRTQGGGSASRRWPCAQMGECLSGKIWSGTEPSSCGPWRSLGTKVFRAGPSQGCAAHDILGGRSPRRRGRRWPGSMVPPCLSPGGPGEGGKRYQLRIQPAELSGPGSGSGTAYLVSLITSASYSYGVRAGPGWASGEPPCPPRLPRGWATTAAPHLPAAPARPSAPSSLLLLGLPATGAHVRPCLYLNLGAWSPRGQA